MRIKDTRYKIQERKIKVEHGAWSMEQGIEILALLFKIYDSDKLTNTELPNRTKHYQI